jgi:thiazole synthase
MTSVKPDFSEMTNVNSSAPSDSASLLDRPLKIGPYQLQSRLIVGSGRFDTPELMRDSLAASGSQCVTVAVRRERLYDREGKNLLEFIDPDKYLLLPNTAGCYNAADAVRVARLGRELLRELENPGANWVKLEVLGDSKTLLPDPVATLEACKLLVQDGFQVLVYSSDDPIIARRLKDCGATSVMPAGSPIGSGQGILNPNNLRIILESLKGDDPEYPVIVDAGVGTASDVAFAFELGADGVLLNSAIAYARHPVLMAESMKLAAQAGRKAFLAGRMPKRLYAQASSPESGIITSRPW